MQRFFAVALALLGACNTVPSITPAPKAKLVEAHHEIALENQNKSRFWLEDIVHQLEAMDESELIAPTKPVGEGEEVIGSASPEIRKLMTLTQRAMNRYYGYVKDFTPLTSYDSDVQAYAADLSRRARALAGLLTISLFESFNAWDGPLVLRKDWVVVRPHPVPTLPEASSSLMH